MSKYEIMLIIDPKEEIKNTEKLLSTIFQKDLTSFEKLKNTELAYPINNSKQAQYAIAIVNTSNMEYLKEFRRQVSLLKNIWRIMVVNLDTEIGFNRKPKKFKKFYKNYVPRQNRSAQYNKGKKDDIGTMKKSYYKKNVKKIDNKKDKS